MKLKTLMVVIPFVILSACTSAQETVQPTLSQPTATQVSIPATQTPSPVPTIRKPAQADDFAFEQNRRLGRGINLGNALEAPREGLWGVTLEEGFFKIIKDGGIDSIRVPIRWNAHAGEKEPYTIDPVFFERVDWVVQNAVQQDLAVILDFHGYDDMMEGATANKPRFLAIWDQIARRYKQAPDSVYFELLNEPYGSLSGTNAWNEILNEAIKIIRQTNPNRTIIVGPGDWYKFDRLYDLQLPQSDRNLIASFHYYLPFQFTHQGADWVEGSDAWMGTTWNGTPEEKSNIERDFDLVKSWSSQNSRPVYLGEFGAYSKADLDSRSRWTTFIARSAGARGFSWAYWEFCAGFGAYERVTKSWVGPIYKALIGSSQ